MQDFDRDRPYTNEALIAALEAANLPPLPDDLREMIRRRAPMVKQILNALLAELETPGKGSPIDELPPRARAIGQMLRADVSLINACTLEEAKMTRMEMWKRAELERQIAGNALH
jgi:hypothetical protein